MGDGLGVERLAKSGEEQPSWLIPLAIAGGLTFGSVVLLLIFTTVGHQRSSPAAKGHADHGKAAERVLSAESEATTATRASSPAAKKQLFGGATPTVGDESASACALPACSPATAPRRTPPKILSEHGSPSQRRLVVLTPSPSPSMGMPPRRDERARWPRVPYNHRHVVSCTCFLCIACGFCGFSASSASMYYEQLRAGLARRAHWALVTRVCCVVSRVPSGLNTRERKVQ